MKKKKISVIIPIYNGEKDLIRCVKSILNQTYKEIEIILINDGSTDSTSEICIELKKSDKRIKYLSTENKGVSHARNKGLLMATGEYITFVDSDDYLEPNMYEEMMNNILESNTDIGICEYDEGKETGASDSSIEIFDRKEAIENLFNNDSYRGFLWNKIYKKEILMKDGNFILFDERLKILEDLVYNYTVFEKANKIVYNHSKFYHYIQRESSALNTVFSKAKLTTLIALDILISRVENEKIKDKLKVDYLRNASYSFYYMKKLYKNDKANIQDLKKAKKKYKYDIIHSVYISKIEKIKCFFWYYLPIVPIFANKIKNIE